MDTLARSYKYRLYPTAEQAAILNEWQYACWDLQRACVIQRRAAWRMKRHKTVMPSFASQGREMTEARHALPHLAAVPSSVLGYIVRRVDQAYKAMFKALKEGQRGKSVPTPRWPRHYSHVGLTFREASRGTKMLERAGRFGYWQLAGTVRTPLGVLKVRMHRAIPDGADVRQAHITRKNDRWFISFSCAIPAPDPLPPAAKAVNGVDLGCKHEGETQRVAIVDDGRIYETGDNLKRSQKRLRTLQRLVDPKRKVTGGAKAADPKSKRSQRRRKRIARLHEKVARQREHEQGYVARRLVDTADTVAFEDINWKALRANGGSRKRGLNRSMSTAAPAALVKLTEIKAEAAGREVAKVDARNTTQACSACGVIGERKDLSVRVWRCETCGAEHDRDVNAARNIAARARGD